MAGADDERGTADADARNRDREGGGPGVDAGIAQLARLQALLADALLAPDPAAFVAARAAAAGADPALRAIDPDGLRLAALLVAKLRFQQLMNASRPAAAWFERDAADFTAAFKRYHRAVPPTALDPWREAATFAAWCASGAGDPPGGPDADQWS